MNNYFAHLSLQVAYCLLNRRVSEWEATILILNWFTSNTH